MRGKVSSVLCTSLCVILAIFLVISPSISIFGSGSILSSPLLAQQQPQLPKSNFTSAEQQLLTEGNSFEIDNVTFSHHSATVNGIQIHYVRGGQGDPVVLLHGYPQSWYEWRHIMPALAKNYTVIAPDLRGFGDSSRPLTGYDGNTTAEDIYQLVSQLGFSKIFLVAHDVGVQPAYSFAALIQTM